MKKLLTISLLLLAVIATTSCRKVIDIDLNSSDPKIVIEGGINDGPGPYTITITRSVNFDESNTFPAYTGAQVVMRDNEGNTEQLTETTPGIYTTSTLQGVPGRTYTLEVTADGKTYTATSQMPYPVNIDTLKIEKPFFGDGKIVNVYWRDSIRMENFYRLIEIVNGVPRKNIYINDDYLQDGEQLRYPLFFNDPEDSLQAGDTVIAVLQCIDKPVHDYLRTLAQLTGDEGGPPAESPANPLTNFNNQALGYFSAYTVKQRGIKIP